MLTRPLPQRTTCADTRESARTYGHNYKVRVTLAGKELDSVGLLYDFVHLKQVIQSVIKSLDHKYLNELKPFDVLNPSDQNIARHIYDETSKQLRQTANGTSVASITVWETDVTAAACRPTRGRP